MDADWTVSLEASKIEEYIGHGFKFKGPGWYSNPFDVGKLLVMSQTRPVESMWHQHYLPGEIFVLYYYDYDFHDRLNQIARAPERVHNGS